MSITSISMTVYCFHVPRVDILGRSSCVTDSVCKPGCEICKCRHAAGNQRRLCCDFAVYITAIIMVLITMLLMIEDRCNTSFAKKCLLCTLAMEMGAKQTWAFSLTPVWRTYLSNYCSHSATVGSPTIFGCPINLDSFNEGTKGALIPCNASASIATKAAFDCEINFAIRSSDIAKVKGGRWRDNDNIINLQHRCHLTINYKVIDSWL